MLSGKKKKKSKISFFANHTPRVGTLLEVSDFGSEKIIGVSDLELRDYVVASENSPSAKIVLYRVFKTVLTHGPLFSTKI